MIIGITGKKSSGKDTVAEYLIEQYDFAKLSFAALLKQSAAALFNIPVEVWEEAKNDPYARVYLKTGDVYPDMTVRTFLQRYGTEAHRGVFGSNFWVDMMWWKEEKTGPLEGDFVISDCRFENEAQSIDARGGKIWRIVRPGQDEADGHASEDLSQTDGFVSLELQNDGTFEKLYNVVDEAMTTLYGF